MTLLKDWLKNLQVYDIDLKLMETAFTHGSYKGLGHEVDDYEKLEFLGDAVIDLIVSDKLYNKGHFSEGDLTELRSLLVKEKPLAALFDKMKLSSLVRGAVASLTPSIKSDVVEAFFAVIYLEKGIKKCREVWDLMMDKTGFEEEVIKNYIDRGKEKLKGLTQEQLKERENLISYYKELGIKANLNARNVLEQLFAKIYRSPERPPKFEDFVKQGPDHSPTFTVRLNETITIKGKTYHLIVEGTAISKKIAAIKAAEKACDILYLLYNKA
ncbi:MAG: ribonuclease III domain-containing protein [Candidatus Helarchaeota archaeon]